MEQENLNNQETAQLGIGAVVRSLRYDKPDKNGWSFNYGFIQRISDKAKQYDDGISMEDVDAILLSLADEQ
jgi:hypothetical protein